MRLFIALDLDSGKEFFKDIQDKINIKGSRLNLTASFHLTLRFLGYVDENDILKIKERLSKVRFSSFDITTAKIGFFYDNHNSIKVIWLGLDDDKDIISLKQNIEEILHPYFPEDKRFHPHITLARIKFVKDKDLLLKNLDSLRLKKKTFSISSFKLMKSTLSSGSPVYET